MKLLRVDEDVHSLVSLESCEWENVNDTMRRLLGLGITAACFTRKIKLEDIQNKKQGIKLEHYNLGKLDIGECAEIECEQASKKQQRIFYAVQRQMYKHGKHYNFTWCMIDNKMHAVLTRTI